MKKKVAVTTRAERLQTKPETIALSGYPLYPVGDDIYNKFYEIADLDPEDFSRKIDAIEPNVPATESLVNSMGKNSGSNLDVPGSELDDKQEAIGNEDEENNYYSFGGDNHNNLDENQGE